MKTTIVKPLENMVQSMRAIRDEINNEIQDMTFAEERAFLDNLLKRDLAKNINDRHGNKTPFS